MPIVPVCREEVTINTEIDESGYSNNQQKKSLIQNYEKIVNWLGY